MSWCPEAVATDSKIDKHLEQITAEVKTAEKLFVDLQGFVANRRLRPHETPIGALIRHAIATATLPSTIEVIVRGGDDLVATLDRDEASRALTTLLTNASQAIAGHGQIWVDAEGTDGEIWIRVRDAGPGVPVEIQGSIFEPLFTTKAKGGGLGLPLARRIVEAHGGTLVLASSDAGATFVMRVPCGS